MALHWAEVNMIRGMCGVKLMDIKYLVMNYGQQLGVEDVVTRSSADADNSLDAFSGQSRSTNMVPFHMLHIVSYCAIVT